VATTSAAKPQYRIFDMNYQEYPARPRGYYFTANGGPVLENLRWNSWGTRRAFARGSYVLDCGTCGPTGEVYRARVELMGPDQVRRLLQALPFLQPHEGHGLLPAVRGRHSKPRLRDGLPARRLQPPRPVAPGDGRRRRLPPPPDGPPQPPADERPFRGFESGSPFSGSASPESSATCFSSSFIRAESDLTAS